MCNFTDLEQQWHARTHAHTAAQYVNEKECDRGTDMWREHSSGSGRQLDTGQRQFVPLQLYKCPASPVTLRRSWTWTGFKQIASNYQRMCKQVSPDPSGHKKKKPKQKGAHHLHVFVCVRACVCIHSRGMSWKPFIVRRVWLTDSQQQHG